MRVALALVSFALGVGCSPAGEREFVREDDVEAPAGSDISVSTFSCSFGVVIVGESASCPITIGSDGERDLIVDGVDLIDVTPENSTPFAVVVATAAGTVLPPGEHAIVDVRFSPVAADEYTGALRVSSNDTRTPAIDVTLTGAGGAP